MESFQLSTLEPNPPQCQKIRNLNQHKKYNGLKGNLYLIRKKALQAANSLKGDGFRVTKLRLMKLLHGFGQNTTIQYKKYHSLLD